MPATKPAPDRETTAPAGNRRGFPVLPTLMVLIVLPILIGFGIWQLQRMHWKDALLVELQRNSALPVAQLDPSTNVDELLFRRLRLDLRCDPAPREIVAGRSLGGQSGYSTIFRCQSGGLSLDVNAGWAPRLPATHPAPPAGLQVGMLAPPAPSDPKVPGFYLEEASPPLKPTAPPSLDSIPNNHFSYAVQWFSFAAILAVIYGLWLRRWLAQRGPAA